MAAAWLIFTTILLVVPGNTLPKTNLVSIPNFDKLVHVGLFAILSLLSIKSLENARIPKVVIVLAGITAYGAAMEFVQRYLVPNRSFDVMDIVADSFGALLGWGIFSLSLRKNTKS